MIWYRRTGVFLERAVSSRSSSPRKIEISAVCPPSPEGIRNGGMDVSQGRSRFPTADEQLWPWMSLELIALHSLSGGRGYHNHNHNNNEKEMSTWWVPGCLLRSSVV